MYPPMKACARACEGDQKETKTGSTKVVIRAQPVREYAVSLRTDQGNQTTHLRYVVMLAQSFQLLVELVNTVLVCHMGLLSDLFE